MSYLRIYFQQCWCRTFPILSVSDCYAKSASALVDDFPYAVFRVTHRVHTMCAPQSHSSVMVPGVLSIWRSRCWASGKCEERTMAELNNHVILGHIDKPARILFWFDTSVRWSNLDAVHCQCCLVLRWALLLWFFLRHIVSSYSGNTSEIMELRQFCTGIFLLQTD